MRTLIGVPCMDMVSTSFMTSLVGLEPVGETELCVMQSSLIYDARNSICKSAIDRGFDRILWLDSDMVFGSQLLIKLSKHLDEGKDFVSGLYFTRRKPTLPTIFNDIRMEKDENGKDTAIADSYKDYPRNSLFEIEACGFGAVMTSVDLVKRVGDTFGLPFSPVLGFGEDISFCLRVRKLGVPMWCDSSIKLGHVGYHMITEDNYERGAKDAGER